MDSSALPGCQAFSIVPSYLNPGLQMLGRLAATMFLIVLFAVVRYRGSCARGKSKRCNVYAPVHQSTFGVVADVHTRLDVAGPSDAGVKAPRDALGFLCCFARPRAAPALGKLVGRANNNANEQVDAISATAACTFGVDDIVRAGVPAEAAHIVATFADRIEARGPEPLSDPTTLWRFLCAREGDLDAAVAMYKETLAWRTALSIRAVMEAHGIGEKYLDDGSRSAPDGTQWMWSRRKDTLEAACIQKFGFFGRLDACAPDGGPIAIWRAGAADLPGYRRENFLPVLSRAFVAHLEDMLQCGRAVSRRSGRLVRGRLIVDAHGLGFGTLSQVGFMKSLMELGKTYFPEVTASITVVRAPRAFAAIYNAMQPFLTPAMRKKVCILGDRFEGGLQAHACIERACLPRFLGGQAPDGIICEAARLPRNALQQLQAQT